MSDLVMMDVTRYAPIREAYELAVRQNELYHAMLIVEQCGASAELTEAIVRLGRRMSDIQGDLVKAVQESAGMREREGGGG